MYKRQHLIFGVVLRFSEDLYCIQDVRFVHHRTERTLIHTGSTGNTLVVVYLRLLVLVHGYGVDLAGLFTRPQVLYYGAVRTDAHTFSAAYALALI